jgi:hypothetical protein
VVQFARQQAGLTLAEMIEQGLVQVYQAPQ